MQPQRATDAKDGLLALLNETNPAKLRENIDIVNCVLGNTVGLWKELNYAYKGMEIAHRIVKLCDDQLKTCRNWKRERRIREQQQIALMHADTYNRQQHAERAAS